MPKKKKIPEEDLIVPPQDQRICGTICVCQMTMVLSCVAIVYLTVAVYMPSLRAFNSGISISPVMCTTNRLMLVEKDGNSSCSEWCLSKSSGACQEIWVSVRKNGSELVFANCSGTAKKTCHGIDQNAAKKYKCVAEDCKNLTGTFNCSEGLCINITDAFNCVYTSTDPPVACTGRRGKIECKELTGLYNCVGGVCERILSPYNCDRRCVDIPTRNKNVIIMSGDHVTLSNCQRTFSTEMDKEVWNETADNILMTSCLTVGDEDHWLRGYDCINGTLLDKSLLTANQANYSYLSHIFLSGTVMLDEERIVAPPEEDLLISNDSQLFINMEGCVNTLQDECHEFFKNYGKDGTDHNARARFPCFYDEDDVKKVFARFNLEAAYTEFLFASSVPTTLFVVSCIVLVICQKTVEVGDDAKMRFKLGDRDNIRQADKENSLTDPACADQAMAL